MLNYRRLLEAAANLRTPRTRFTAVFRSGNSSTASITGLNFAPRLIWTKSVSTNQSHMVMSDFGLNGQYVETDDLTYPPQDIQIITSFNSDGVTFGNRAIANGFGNTYINFLWPLESDATDEAFSKGSGISVVGYTGNATNRLINHSLGKKPDMIITRVKLSSPSIFTVLWHKDLATPALEYLQMDVNDPAASDATMWNSQEPTATQFSLGTHASSNAGGGYEAMLFTSVPGFSDFGFYTGNGNISGPIIDVGFSGGAVWIKRMDGLGGNWHMYDNRREEIPPQDKPLYGNLNFAATQRSNEAIELNSLGFIVRSTINSLNELGGRYMYMLYKKTWL